MKILIPAYTVAEWGGLHEYVISAATTLVKCGHEVTLVLQDGLVAEKGEESGADVIRVDWSDWGPVAEEIRRGPRYDLIFAQPFHSRKFALFVNEIMETRLVAMFHGFHHDFVYTWQHLVDGFLVTTEQIGDLLVDLCRIDPERVRVAPNGVDMDRFAYPLLALDEKTADGRGLVVMASRIDKDKRSQVTALKLLIEQLSRHADHIHWDVVVLGDGPERGRVELELEKFIEDYPNISVEMRGWVPADTVPRLMNRAVFSVSAGRGAMQSLAVGTPCLAAGARGIAGLQIGSNLEIGVWSNFADYPIVGKDIVKLEDNLQQMLIPNSYAEAQIEGRARILADRSQQNTAVRMVEALTTFASR
ncbi:glycosyltransferase family 4 protein [Pseudarthrobacter sp. So.54]